MKLREMCNECVRCCGGGGDHGCAAANASH
jgi:hypothetical protein